MGNACVLRLKFAICAAAVAAFASAAAYGHIVSTNVTWNREVSRIVYSRCGTCHRPGGSAFSLLTYQDASPWANAIKADVLQQKMPPWGAVKGFGTFRNDEALTPDERDLIQIWADGGAPEGNPNELPLQANIPALPNAAAHVPGEIVAAGEYKFASAFTLDGFWVENFPGGASAQITLQYPNGRIQPLVWLYNYTAQDEHPFLLRSPLPIAPGTMIHGIPDGASFRLLPASEKSSTAGSARASK